MPWCRTLQVLSGSKVKKLLSLLLVGILVMSLASCSILDFDKNKNTYITEPSQMEGLNE